MGSRLLIVLAIFVIAPLVAPDLVAPDLVAPDLVAPDLAQGLGTLTANDGQWYLRIATEGYTVDPDGAMRSPAFFPLFPALISGNDVSAERLTDGIASLGIAAGFALESHPCLGYGLLPVLGMMLITVAIQVSQGVVWV